MAPDRKYYNGKGKTKEREFEKVAESHADRAAQLLAKARTSPAAKAASASASASAESPPSSSISSTSKETIALPTLIKSLANPQLGNDAMTIKEAIPVAGKLTRAKLNTNDKLSLLNSILLEEARISSEADRHKILVAFGVRKVGSTKESEKSKAKGALDVLSSKPSFTSKRRRAVDDDALSREYGNISAPINEAGEGEQMDYIFHEIVEEEIIKGRRAVINRAPIMTAWATIVLEKLGFLRREALSLAHCYVHTTSTARGISLGIIPVSERQRSVNVIGSNQPHFELMGVKIPLMKLGKTQEWRGISQGQVIGPDNAFNYLRKSMHQTLPAIMGALNLLADSYCEAGKQQSENIAFYEPNSGPEYLHANAYDLYTKFRPSTAGEWGKKSTFFCGKALALRRGSKEDMNLWEQVEEGDHGQQREIQAFEQELQKLINTEAGVETIVKEEAEEEEKKKEKEIIKVERCN